MPRVRIVLLAALIALLGACQPQGPETTLHRWDRASWDQSYWH